MKNRLLATEGKGKFYETEYVCDEPSETQIQVKSRLTGICRSDIDMMNSSFALLPLSMQGHEGLGEVIKCGGSVSGIQVGDFVATRGEPAYADIYNVEQNNFIKVPEASPKYILEPVACGINLILQPYSLIEQRASKRSKLLILGSGFLAHIAYQYLKLEDLWFDIDVVGHSNKQIWGDALLSEIPHNEYDVIIDLSSHQLFSLDVFKTDSLIIFGTQKTVTTDFSNLLWKACTMVFPSPRFCGFYDSMLEARSLVDYLKVDKFWTKGYDRDTEWEKAFDDGLNRKQGYSRGYLIWNQH